MTAVSPGSPGAPAGGSLEEPAALPLRRAATEAAPDDQSARQMVQLMITGHHPVINYTIQHVVGSGTSVSAAGRTVAVAGADGTAIGSQTARGANSSVAGTQTARGAGFTVAGGQSVQAGRDAVTAGQDAVPGAGEQPAKEGWWARLRKRGAVVAFATIVGALAGVAGVVIAIMVTAGWKP